MSATGSSEARGGNTEDEDNISLRSTEDSEWASDREYELEGILSEKEEKGKISCLVEWTGFPLDQATWEPVEQMPELVLEQWNEQKQKIAAGEAEPFDVEEWNRSITRKWEAKARRHSLRNRRRRRLGQDDELTLPISDDGSYESSIDESLEEVSPPRPKPQQKSPPRRTEPKKAKAPAPKPNIPKVGASAKQPAQASTSDASPKKKASIATTGYQSTARRLTTGQNVAEPSKKPAPAGMGKPLKSTGPIRRASDPINTTQAAGKPAPSGSALLVPRQSKTTGSTATGRPVGPSGPGGIKRATAKKSKPKMAAAGNIFISGTKRKKRQTLTEAMMDPSKDAKIFNRKRFERLAELRSRELADRGPSFESVKHVLVPTRAGLPGAAQQAGGADAGSPTAASPSAAGPVAAMASPSLGINTGIAAFSFTGPMSAVLPSAPLQMPTAPASLIHHSPVEANAPPPPLLRRASKGSILKSSASSGRLNTMDGGARKHVQFAEAEDVEMVQTPEEMNETTPQEEAPPEPTQRVKKSAKFGGKNAGAFDVLFSGIPRDDSQTYPWLEQFIWKYDTLDFSHKCASSDYRSQMSPFASSELCRGAVVAAEGAEERVENVAEYLRLGGFGVWFTGRDFSVLVYPGRSEEWREVFPVREGQTAPSDSLRHVMFISGLWPYIHREQAPLIGQSPPEDEILNSLFEINYEKLLPLLKKPEHLPYVVFYVMMPRKATLLHTALLRWLKIKGGEGTKVFTSFNVGSWNMFVTAATAGVVIIHESLINIIRAIPDVSKLLFQKYISFNIWYLSESLQINPVFPSTVFDRSEKPGRIWAHRLFPHGNMILLTPSFLVTDPARALRIVKHFAKYQLGQYWRLVLCAGFVDFVRELAMEKENEKVQERWSLFLAAQDLHARNMEAKGFQESVMYAPDCIDANDEQSLVNWYGETTWLCLDQYRKFSIVGSNASPEHPPTRTISLPRYRKGTINDPDIVVAVAPQSPEPEPEPEPMQTNSEPQMQRQAPLPSVVLGTNVGLGLINWMQDIVPRLRKKAVLRLYNTPISYVDFPMSNWHERNGLRPLFRRFADWWKYPDPFNLPFNTYMGLFITPPEGGSVPPEVSRFSHLHWDAWVVAYRPVSPHKFPWQSGSELLIWDPAAPARLEMLRAGAKGGRDGRTQDSRFPRSLLLPMQRKLVDYVRANTEQKNKNLPLAQVWLGGWDNDEGAVDDQRKAVPPIPNAKGASVLDRALLYLESAAHNARPRMPAVPNYLPERGWRAVAMDADDGDWPAADVDAMDADPPNPNSVPLGRRSSGVGIPADAAAAKSPSPSELPLVIDVEAADNKDVLLAQQHDYTPYDDGVPSSQLDPLARTVVFHAPPVPGRGRALVAGTEEALRRDPVSQCRNRLFDYTVASRRAAELRPARAARPGRWVGGRLVVADAEPDRYRAAAADDDGTGRPVVMKYSWPPTAQWYATQQREGRGFGYIALLDGREACEFLWPPPDSKDKDSRGGAANAANTGKGEGSQGHDKNTNTNNAKTTTPPAADREQRHQGHQQPGHGAASGGGGGGGGGGSSSSSRRDSPRTQQSQHPSGRRDSAGGNTEGRPDPSSPTDQDELFVEDPTRDPPVVKTELGSGGADGYGGAGGRRTEE